jgi:hypothetical protein
MYEFVLIIAYFLCTLRRDKIMAIVAASTQKRVLSLETHSFSSKDPRVFILASIPTIAQIWARA